MHNVSLHNELVIIDLDYTLVRENTTYSYLKFIAFRRYLFLSKILSPVSLLSKLVRKDIYKRLLVCLCIGGKPEKLLIRYANGYFSLLSKDPSRFNLSVIKSLHNTNGTLVLLTASLDIVAQPFQILGFHKIIGSQTYFRNNKFHSFHDLYGVKHRVISALLSKFDKITVIEDCPEPEYYAMKGVKVEKVLET